MADWLSESNGVGPVTGEKSFVMSVLSQRASLEADVAVMYSLSVVDNDTISWCFEL